MLQASVHTSHKPSLGAGQRLQPAVRPLNSRKRLQPRSSISTSSVEPTITIKFLQDGAEAVSIDCPSGDQLRAQMLENKVDLYTTWGKVWSCGGAGQCGTCIVQVNEGADLLSERTATEDKKLNKKPDNWRLACQTIVGDGTNSGTLVIQTKPQK